MSVKRRTAHAAHFLPLLVVALLLTGCLEQETTARIPAGAARNFFYFLAQDEEDDAMTYWAPGQQPADARAQVQRAAAALADYNATVMKVDSAPQSDGSQIVTLSGPLARKPAAATGANQPLLRAHLIMIGPGWRLTDFTLLCCEK